MRTRLLAGVATVIAALVIAPDRTRAGNLDYILINNTDQPIVRAWASPTTDPNWIESTDVYVGSNGGRQQQDFDESGSGSDCYYDIRIQFQGGSRSVINHIDLCSTSRITIDANNGHVTYDAE